MASPVNIRVAALIPFPALVGGAAPIAVSKLNGKFTIALDVADLGSGVPNASAYGTDYIIVYDSIAKTFMKVSLSTIGASGSLLQRAANASPIVVAFNDQIINFNINGGAPTCALPGYVSRQGVPLTFKDAGGHAAAHNLTITPAAGETIDGQANFVMNTNFQKITLTPYNDGVNTGWFT